jgi:hypothetical protein
MSNTATELTLCIANSMIGWHRDFFIFLLAEFRSRGFTEMGQTLFCGFPSKASRLAGMDRENLISTSAGEGMGLRFLWAKRALIYPT